MDEKTLKETEVSQRNRFLAVAGETENYHSTAGRVELALSLQEWRETRRELMKRHALRWLRCYICRKTVDSHADPECWVILDNNNDNVICQDCRTVTPPCDVEL